MKGLIYRWILNAAALILIAKVIEGISVDGFLAALVATFILGVVNAVIRPIILFFTLPLTFLTLGLFTLVINGLMLFIVDSVVAGFEVTGWLDAIIGALLLSILSTTINWLVKDK